MAGYRGDLPQLGSALFLTDGGLETTLVFHVGLELPCFAAFPLLETEQGEAILRRYFASYLEIARGFETGFILESVTWRCSAEWGARLGFSPEALAGINRRAIGFLTDLREAWTTERTPIVVSGCVGPRGDGYAPRHRMSVPQAADYHRAQIETFAGTAADMVAAITMTHPEEAAGIASAAREAGLPSAVSFTVETDGRLPTGQPLGEAIAQVDAVTDEAPSYYMINCAHPRHFEGALEPEAPWVRRIRGLRANASTRSHAELDASAELDEGDPAALGRDYRALRERFPQLTVLGGCCGTDHRHIDAIARCCTTAAGAGP